MRKDSKAPSTLKIVASKRGLFSSLVRLLFAFTSPLSSLLSPSFPLPAVKGEDKGAEVATVEEETGGGNFAQKRRSIYHYT